MPSFDDRPRSPFSPNFGPSQPVSPQEFSPLGGNPSMPPAPFGEQQQGTNSTNLVPWSTGQWSPVVTTGSLPDVSGVTRVLTGALPNDPQTTSMRTPVVIKGTRKKTTAAPLPPHVHKKRRLFVSLVGILLLCLVTMGTVFAVTPLGHDTGLNFDPMQIGSNAFNNQNNGASNLIAQATATAVYHQQTDGYVPPSGGVTSGAGSLAWPLGQCTYWANLRYHQLTGHWVAWTGNADQWVAGARAAGNGWMVSQTPHVPSIIVMMPYVQGASGYGHVAVVESINANGSVHTSNMNWYANGGGWDKESFVDFNTGSGIYFVYHT